MIFNCTYLNKTNHNSCGVPPTPIPNHTILSILYNNNITRCRRCYIKRGSGSSRTSYDRNERVLFLSYDGWATSDDGRQSVVEGRMWRNSQHGCLLPRGLFANSSDPMEADRPEHKPDDHVHCTSDIAKMQSKAQIPHTREACIIYIYNIIKV